MIDYYTVTLNDEKEDARGIWIGLALDDSDARNIFNHMYGDVYKDAIQVKRGIELEGVCDLVTESAKKYLIKFKSRSDDKPVAITYTNFVHLTH